jgi:small subunit ribosomal protein S13
MPRIAGVDINEEKKAKIALTRVYGVGMSKAMEILDIANVDPEKLITDFTNEEVNRINKVIEQNYKVEGELKQQVFRNIKRLKDIKCYRGIRHKVGLPVRGQNTRTNAVTRKGKNQAVGGLKRVLEKT